MKIRYFALVSPFGQMGDIEIDDERFNSLLKARSILSGALALEEKFDLLISNYFDLESECLNCVLRSMVYYEPAYDYTAEAMLTINRRTVNLLTSARLYVDQLPQHVKSCLPDEDSILGKINAIKSSCYDGCF
jgi:hypothetical protein